MKIVINIPVINWKRKNIALTVEFKCWVKDTISLLEFWLIWYL